MAGSAVYGACQRHALPDHDPCIALDLARLSLPRDAPGQTIASCINQHQQKALGMAGSVVYGACQRHALPDHDPCVALDLARLSLPRDAPGQTIASCINQHQQKALGMAGSAVYGACQRHALPDHDSCIALDLARLSLPRDAPGQTIASCINQHQQKALGMAGSVVYGACQRHALPDHDPCIALDLARLSLPRDAPGQTIASCINQHQQKALGMAGSVVYGACQRHALPDHDPCIALDLARLSLPRDAAGQTIASCINQHQQKALGMAGSAVYGACQRHALPDHDPCVALYPAQPALPRDAAGHTVVSCISQH
jgi:hypothetical protein